MSGAPEIITVIRSGEDLLLMYDGKPFPFPVAVSYEEPIEINVMPGPRPPCIRVTIPANRVEVIDGKDLKRVTGVIREMSRRVLGEVDERHAQSLRGESAAFVGPRSADRGPSPDEPTG